MLAVFGRHGAHVIGDVVDILPTPLLSAGSYMVTIVLDGEG